MEITDGEKHTLFDAIQKRKFSIAETIEIIEKAPAPRSWRDEDHYFSLVSDGTSGQDWITRLEKNGWLVSDYAKEVLLSDEFKPTKGVITQVILYKKLPGANIIESLNNAKANGLKQTSAEVACLICDFFSQKEFYERGIVAVVIMHKPIKARNGYHNDPGTLCITDVFNATDKKKLTAMSLKDDSSLGGWQAVFER